MIVSAKPKKRRSDAKWIYATQEEIRERDRLKRQRFAKKHPEYERNYNRKMREDTLAVLGNKCVRCGFADYRALTLMGAATWIANVLAAVLVRIFGMSETTRNYTSYFVQIVTG